MCKMCVENGSMTQEELDEANAAEPGTDERADGSAAAFFLDGAPEFLRDLLKAELERGDSEDPNTAAQERMDQQILKIMEIHRTYLGNAQEYNVELAGSPQGKEAVSEAIAGILMFKQNPPAIAFTLALLIDRYVQLLDQWAELYVKMADDPDKEMDLDAATTAESKVAVTDAAARVHSERTGMYL